MFSQRLVRGKRFFEVSVSDEEPTVCVTRGLVGQEGTELRKTFETNELAEKYAKRTVSNKTGIGFIPVEQVARKAGMRTRASSLKRSIEEAEIALNVSKNLRRSKRLSGGTFTQSNNDGRGVVDPECSIKGTIVSLDSVGVCDVMLAQVVPSAGVDNFIVLQLIQEKGRNDSFVVFKRWGVTGQVGSISEQWFRGLAEAVLTFGKQFKQGTGMDWPMSDHAKPIQAVPTAPATSWGYQQLVQDDECRRALASGNHGWWFYWVDDHVDGKETGWYPYDAAGAKTTEKLFLESQLNTNYTQRVVKSGFYSYLVDLATETQTNITLPSRTMRQIRRQPYGAPLDESPPHALYAAWSC